MRMRPIRGGLLGMALVLLALAGCGDKRVDDGGRGTFQSPDADPCVGTEARGEAVVLVHADLDGDNAPEAVSSLPRTRKCGPLLIATVDGDDVVARIDDELPIAPGGSFAVAVPGRSGDLVLVRQEHPRGGFQVRLFGYADGRLGELYADGGPVFPFIATDVMSTPLAATCATGGFTVTEARAHQPIGVAPTWDVYRTTYTVDGNTVTERGSTEVADNVLPEQLEASYADLVDPSLFENCRASG
jgi:hypothetical protein